MSRSATRHATRRLVVATRAAGAQPRVVDPDACDLSWDQALPVLRIHGRRAPLPDVVIPRVGALSPALDLHLLGHLEAAGCVVLNPRDATLRARDKVSCAQVLAWRGVPVPRGVLLPSPVRLHDAVRRVGGPPVVVKRARGAGGVGVMLAHTLDEAASHARLLWDVGAQVVVQEYLAEAGGADVRAFVVGGRLVAAMERRARAGEFRANLHQGGSVRAAALDAATRRVVEKAARTLGLDVAGVDLIASARGPLVVEVNASPGLRGIELATGIDVATAVVRHALSRFSSPARPGRRPAARG